MAKKAGLAAMLLGAALLLAALLLWLVNLHRAETAGQASAQLLDAVEEWMQAQTAAPAVQTAASPEIATSAPDEADAAPPDTEMTVVEISGCACVGRLEIPALALALPVLSTWDEERLQIAPCRQHGAAASDDLVIAAHNYASHFGRLKELAVDDTVRFTDLDGRNHIYRIAKIATVAPDEVDAVLNSGCALVLYTCTAGGKSRLCVFCDRVPEETA